MNYAKQTSKLQSGVSRNQRLAPAKRIIVLAGVSCLLTALVAAPAAAGPIVIDDFVDTARTIFDVPPNTFTPPAQPGDGVFNQVITTAAVPGGLGGQRDLLIEVDTQVSPLEVRDATGLMGEGSFKFLSASSAGVFVSLLYGDPLGDGSQTLDLLDGTNDELQLWFDSIDGGVNTDFAWVDIIVTSNDGVNLVTADWISDPVNNPSRLFFDSSTDVVYSTPFSEFVTLDSSPPGGTIDFSNITSVRVDFNFFDSSIRAVPGLDFKLTSIVADTNVIPEPATAGLAVMGLIGCTVGFAGRRRHRRR